MAVGILGDAEQRVIDGRQFIESDEIAIEGATLLKVGHVDADFDFRVRLGRRVGDNYQLQCETTRIQRKCGTGAITFILEGRRGITKRPKARDQRRFVWKKEREQTDAGRFVHASEVILPSFLKAGGKLDLPAADAKEDHLRPAAEVNRR